MKPFYKWAGGKVQLLPELRTGVHCMSEKKVYIATSLSNAAEAASLAEALRGANIEVTYPWWTHGPVWDLCAHCGLKTPRDICPRCGVEQSLVQRHWRCADTAISEAQGVRDADLVVVILTDMALPCSDCGETEPEWTQPNAQRGTHTELGLAIACGKPILIFASSAKRFESNETCAFYFHPAVVAREVLLPDHRKEQMAMQIAGFFRDRERATPTARPAPAGPTDDFGGTRCRECGAVYAGKGNCPVCEETFVRGARKLAGAEPLIRASYADREYDAQGRPKLAEVREIRGSTKQDDPLGFDSPPARYSDNPDGKETIDRMFEEAERVLLGVEFGEDADLYEVSASRRRALRAAVCAAIALKYEDRAGKKGDAEGDACKASFYRAMQQRWEQNDPSLDPRAYRAKREGGEK